MLPTDYALVFPLWQATEGIGLSQSDTESAIAAFLERNPGFSAVAVAEHAGLVGAVLCGHDGRRGYLHHLAVARAHRKRGNREGPPRSLPRRARLGAHSKVQHLPLHDNEAGTSFWLHAGFAHRGDLRVLQRWVPGT